MEAPLSLDEQFFYRIAVKNGLIDKRQGIAVIQKKVQLRRGGRDRPLDQILLDEGLITREQVKKIREAQAASQIIRLDTIYGDIAVARGLLSPDAVLWALARQRERRFRARIGELLVDAGKLTPADHRRVLDELLRRIERDERDAPAPGASASAAGAPPDRGTREAASPEPAARPAGDPLPQSDWLPESGSLPASSGGSAAGIEASPAPVRGAAEDSLAAETDDYFPAPPPAPRPTGSGSAASDPHGFMASSIAEARSSDFGEQPPPRPPRPEDSTVDQTQLPPAKKDGPGATLLASALELRMRYSDDATTEDGATGKAGSAGGGADAADLLSDDSIFKAGLLDSDRVSVGSDIRAVEDLIGSGEKTFAALDGLATSGTGGQFSTDDYLRRRRRRNLRIAATTSAIVFCVVASGSAVLASIRAEAGAVAGATAALDDAAATDDPARRAEHVGRAADALAGGSPLPFLRQAAERTRLDGALRLFEAARAVEEAIAAGENARAEAALERADAIARGTAAGGDGVQKPPAWFERLQRRLRFQTLMLDAERAHREGRRAEAAQLCRRANAGAPGGEDRADRLLRALREETGARVAQAEQALDPAAPETFDRLVAALRAQAAVFPEMAGEVERALRDLDYDRLERRARTALAERRPADALDLVGLARRFAREQQDAALEELEATARALRGFLEDMQVAADHERAYRLDEARDAYRRALQRAPDDELRKRASEAVARVEKEKKLEQEDAEVRRRYAAALQHLAKGRPSEAEAELGALRKLSADDPRYKDAIRFCKKVQEMDLVYVPAGPFEMGSDVGERTSRPNEQPRHEARIARAFFLGRKEVTNAEFKKFLDASGYQPTRAWPPEALRDPQRRRRVKSKLEDHPVTHVAFGDALAYARWAGGRLPTEEEWEKAARGTDGRRFPWGAEADPARTRVKTPVPTFENRSSTAKVGSHPGDASFYGVLDMGGNVSEWIDSPYVGYPGGPPQPEYGKGFKIVRGGSWRVELAAARCAFREYGSPDQVWDDTGFRIVLDVPDFLPELAERESP